MNNALFRSVVIIIAATLLCRSTLAKITVLPDEEIDHVDDSAPPFYQECKKTSDCPASYCCVLGMMRYQMPFCLPIGRLGDPCHPYAENNYRRNFTLNFPNLEDGVHIEESWLLMCPCAKGFSCSKEDATCRKNKTD